MEDKRPRRYQIIELRMAFAPENVVEGGILLWKRLATHIISIVGENGFSALYARSIYLTQPTFSWLSVSVRSPLTPADQLLADLKLDFAGQAPADVSVANRLLLFTFADILSSLIGEELTVSILCSAWGNDAPPCADKEFSNE